MFALLEENGRPSLQECIYPAQEDYWSRSIDQRRRMIAETKWRLASPEIKTAAELSGLRLRRSMPQRHT
jgi:hypothetical protein